MNILYILNLNILLVFFLFLCITKIYDKIGTSRIVVATELYPLKDIIIVDSYYNK